MISAQKGEADPRPSAKSQAERTSSRTHEAAVGLDTMPRDNWKIMSKHASQRKWHAPAHGFWKFWRAGSSKKPDDPAAAESNRVNKQP